MFYFLSDSGNKAIRVVTNAELFRKLSSLQYPCAQVFDIDHHRGAATTRFSFSEAISVIERWVFDVLGAAKKGEDK